jgi:threonine/homoserine/homoserine lactone efflux protein
MESILLGLGVGLFAGLIPGAYSTVVATTALERGLGEGLKVSAVPVLTESFVMLLAVFVLSRLPEATLRWIGIAGGLLLLFMAWRVFRDARRGGEALSRDGSKDTSAPGGWGGVPGGKSGVPGGKSGVPGDDPRGDGDRGKEDQRKEAPRGDARAHLLRVAAFGLLAPGAWAFWFLVGAPLILNRWGVGPLHAIGFYLAFLAAFTGAMAALSWALASGRKHLTERWHRRVLRGASGLLVVVGGVLIWQSWMGNFTEMVRTPEALEEPQGFHRPDGPALVATSLAPAVASVAGTESRPSKRRETNGCM